jgi:mannitol-specific phosphotransferase system IIBC component
MKAAMAAIGASIPSIGIVIAIVANTTPGIGIVIATTAIPGVGVGIVIAMTVAGTGTARTRGTAPAIAHLEMADHFTDLGAASS